MKNFTQLLSLVIIGGLFFVGGSLAQKSYSAKSPRTITVTGLGTINTTPDTAEVTLGVQTGRQKTSQITMSTLNNKIAAITAAVEAVGIEQKNIKTDSLWLNPAYDYVNGTQRDAGFEATQNVKITIKDISKLSAVIDASVEAGANQVQNVQFAVSESNNASTNAREMAISNAQQKAQQLAQQLGVTLGRVESFTESNQGYNPPVPMMARAESDAGMGGGAVVPEGEQVVQSNVTIMYSIR